MALEIKCGQTQYLLCNLNNKDQNAGTVQYNVIAGHKPPCVVMSCVPEQAEAMQQATRAAPCASQLGCSITEADALKWQSQPSGSLVGATRGHRAAGDTAQHLTGGRERPGPAQRNMRGAGAAPAPALTKGPRPNQVCADSPRAADSALCGIIMAKTCAGVRVGLGGVQFARRRMRRHTHPHSVQGIKKKTALTGASG